MPTDIISGRAKSKREDNPPKIYKTSEANRLSLAAYYERNQERIKARVAEYQRSNAEQKRASDAAYNAAHRGQQSKQQKKINGRHRHGTVPRIGKEYWSSSAATIASIGRSATNNQKGAQNNGPQLTPSKLKKTITTNIETTLRLTQPV